MPDALFMLKDSCLKAIAALSATEPTDRPLKVPVTVEVLAFADLLSFDIAEWVDLGAKAAGYPGGEIISR